MLSISVFISTLQQKNVRELPVDEFKEFVSSQLDKSFDAEILASFEAAMRESVPGYKPLSEEQKQSRKATHEIATLGIGQVMYDLVSGMNNVPDIENVDRSFQAMFFGMGNTANDIKQKNEMMRVIKNGTPEERHDLFLETMDRMAQFPMEEFRSAGTTDKLMNMSAYMPMLQLGMEGENLLKLFKGMNCGVTEEEEKQFTTMFAELNAESMGVTNELDMMLNPYYASVDCTQVPRDIEIRRAMDEAVQERGVPDGNAICQLSSSAEVVVDNQAVPNRSKVGKLFKAAGLIKDEKELTVCTPKGKPLPSDNFTNRDTQWFREGKTVYFTNKNGPNKEVMAFRDLAGNGVITKVPPEVKKPNGFVRFFDKINRAFGGKGLKSVNNYNEYTQKIADLTEQARGKTVNDEYKDAAKKVHEKVEERRQEKAAAEIQIQMRQSTVEETAVTKQTEVEVNTVFDEIPEVIDTPAKQEKKAPEKKPEPKKQNEPEEVDYEDATPEEREYWRIARQVAEKDPFSDAFSSEEMDWQIAEFWRERNGDPVPRKVRPKKPEMEASKENYPSESSEISEQSELTQEIEVDTAPKSVTNQQGTVEKPKTVEEQNNTVYSGGDEEPDEPSAQSKDVENKKPTVERTPEEIEADRKKAFNFVYEDIKAEAEDRVHGRSFDDDMWRHNHKDLMESLREEAQKKYDADVREAREKPERDRIDEEASARMSRVNKGFEIAKQYFYENKFPSEQKKWAAQNPDAMRDGIEMVKANYLADKKTPYEPKVQNAIKNFDKNIKSFNQLAVEQNDPVAVAKEKHEKLAPEARNASIKIAKNMMLTGKQTPEEAKWTAENPEAVRDALTLAKHEYTLKHDNKPHDKVYYQLIHNADKHIIDTNKLVQEKAKQNTQNKTVNQPTKAGPNIP